MSREIYKLNHVDPENIGDVLLKVQRSFNITLDNDGLKDVDTLGNLCDLIVNKINHDHSENCSTQHAFYQLRNAMHVVTGMDKCAIKPQTRLSAVFPKENRQQLIIDVEEELGFKADLLKPRQSVFILLGLLFIVSFAGCFYNWQIGLAGILASLIGLKLAGKFGKEIHLKTVGDLANKISRESILRSKKNSCAVNKREVEQKVKELFTNDLELRPITVRRESRFN